MESHYLREHLRVAGGDPYCRTCRRQRLHSWVLLEYASPYNPWHAWWSRECTACGVEWI